MRFLSTRTHAVIGLIVGLALILAPNLFGFSDVDAAATVARVIGVLLLVSELTTDNGLSPAKLIPMPAHLVMDFLAGAVLFLSPWLFGFSDAGTNAWVPHVIVGLLVAGYPMFTKTVPDDSREASA